MVFVDPDREFVTSLGLEHLPAFVHLRQNTTLANVAEGWDAREWQRVASEIGKAMAWTHPEVAPRRAPTPDGWPAAAVWPADLLTAADLRFPSDPPSAADARVRVWPARTSKDVRASCYPRPHSGLMTTTPPPRRRAPGPQSEPLVLLCAVGGLLGTVPVNTASAAPIDDLRARGRRHRAADERPRRPARRRSTSRSRRSSSRSTRRSRPSPTRRPASPPRRPKSRASPTWCASGPRACTAAPGNKASPSST